MIANFIFQFGYFFENDLMPKLKHKNFQNSNDSGTELPSADFLLENVAKIERKIIEKMIRIRKD